MSTARYIVGDVRDALATIPDGTVDLVLTSPPFLALRSYLPDDHPDKHREIGGEPDPATFVDTMLGLTAEWRRVLADHGTLAVEFGDTYSSDPRPATVTTIGRGRDRTPVPGHATGGPGWPPAKSLALIPELYRIALAYGRHPLTGTESPAGLWRVRNVVRWVRPNPPVGALGDKFRPATSDLVIACTSRKRWFDLDAVRTPHTAPGSERTNRADGARRAESRDPTGRETNETVKQNPAGAPPLDWWAILPGGYPGQHYATFPAELCRRPIEAMCPRRVCTTCGAPSRRMVDAQRTLDGEPADLPALSTTERNGAEADGVGHWRKGTTYTTVGWTTCGCPGADGIRLDGYHTGTSWRPGMVLDPFGGTGTTAVVATGRGRNATLIDLDPRNLELARQRLGMFLTDETVL